jgi:hypothetical protein
MVPRQDRPLQTWKTFLRMLSMHMLPVSIGHAAQSSGHSVSLH